MILPDRLDGSSPSGRPKPLWTITVRGAGWRGPDGRRAGDVRSPEVMEDNGPPGQS